MSASANPAATTEQSSFRWRWAKAVASIGTRLIGIYLAAALVLLVTWIRATEREDVML